MNNNVAAKKHTFFYLFFDNYTAFQHRYEFGADVANANKVYNVNTNPQPQSLPGFLHNFAFQY